MGRRPTIIDVAEAAGVSKSTVSLVLQNSSRVKDETRRKVRTAIEATGYVYNRGAAHLRGGKTGLIGLVINDLRNPYFTEFAVSTQMTFANLGFATVVANTNDDWVLQEQIIRSMLEHDVDALVISPCYGGPGKDFDDILRSGIPAMQVLRQVDARLDQLPFCGSESDRGTYLAVDHLLRRGATRIAFVGGDLDLSVTRARYAGYERRLAESGHSTRFFPGARSRAFGREAALMLVRDHPEIDAAVTFNDLVALGMMAGFAQTGIRLGTSFRLVGFDDIEEARQVHPKLSTVRSDVNQLGADVARLMLDWLTHGTHPGPSRHYPVTLMARETS